MVFKINNRTWKIVEVSQEEMREKIKAYDMVDTLDSGRYLGSTQEIHQVIYLDKDLCEEQKRQTLYHELMHCYIVSYLFSMETIDIEQLCNISACSHDIIHAIATKYFERNDDNNE